MINHILKVFKEMINSSPWMDEITKTKALNKTNAMNRLIAFPDSIVTKEDLGEYYKGVSMSSAELRGRKANDPEFLLTSHFLFWLMRRQGSTVSLWNPSCPPSHGQEKSMLGPHHCLTSLHQNP